MSKTDSPRIDEGEWQAQERGMRAARGRGEGGIDAAAARYRVVAQALASAPRSEPPGDFAAAVAQRIAGRDARFERRLSRSLLAVFVAVSITVGARYGGQWWQPLRQAFGNEALGWMLAGVGCVALSWLLGRLPGLADPVGGAARTAQGPFDSGRGRNTYL